jgi:hypothetical protein
MEFIFMMEGNTKICLMIWPLLVLAACQEQKPCSLEAAKNVSWTAARGRFPDLKRENVTIRNDGDHWLFAYYIDNVMGGAPMVSIDKKSCKIVRLLTTQ